VSKDFVELVAGIDNISKGIAMDTSSLGWPRIYINRAFSQLPGSGVGLLDIACIR